MPVAENIRDIKERIAAAARRKGRTPDDVALMAVSKTVSPDKIRQAYQVGLRLFGESRVQEMAAKADAVARRLRQCPSGIGVSAWHSLPFSSA